MSGLTKNKVYLFTVFLSITLLLYVVLLSLQSTSYHVNNRTSLTQQTHRLSQLAHRASLKTVDASNLIYHEDNRTSPTQQTHSQQTHRADLLKVTKGNSSLHILYLTQTEKCLPKYLKSPEVIGDTTACQCDVLVLSYKEECKDTSMPHVKYIFQPSTTWTTGRNLLYATSKARDKFYLYYIFLDDDTILHAFDKALSKNILWRMFEDSLRSVQPPIVTVDPLIRFHRLSQPKDCEPEHVTNYAQVFWFDAMFNAFHGQAIHYILPYPTKFDKRSWYYSQMYVMVRGDVKFHGQVVGDTRFRAQNSKHRPYPREHNWSTLKIVARDVRKEVPEKYQKSSEPILQLWIKNNGSRNVSWYFYCSNVFKQNTVLSHYPFEGLPT